MRTIRQTATLGGAQHVLTGAQARSDEGRKPVGLPRNPMMRGPRRRRSAKLLAAGLVLATVGGIVALGPGQAEPQVTDPLTAAWQGVQDSGSYRFNSTIQQTTTPTASVLNAGRSSTVEELYIEASADMDASAVELEMWLGASSLASDPSGTLRVVDGRTEQRVAGGEWQEVGDATGVIAPGGDVSSYLMAAKDVELLGTDNSVGIDIERYGFRIDGPEFAAAITPKLEAAMRESGRLSSGAGLSLPSYYLGMTGTGELWVDSTGLPIRQTLSLQFPEQNGETSRAEMTVDFLDYGYASTGPDTTTLLSQVLSTGGDLLPMTLLGLAVLLLAFGAIVVFERRPRRAQAGVVFVIAMSFLMDGSMVQASTERPAVAPNNVSTATGQIDAVELQRMVDAERDAAAADPTVSRLSSDERSALLARASGTALLPNNSSGSALLAQGPMLSGAPPVDSLADTDSDGLTDFVEARIGTDPTEEDTDGDGRSDQDEVIGFRLGAGGPLWFPDPTAVDSNNDGISDNIEWDIDGNGSPNDTDGDDIPDLFDDDNDGDGVPDRLDLAPFTQGDATFDDTNPLLLSIDNLSVGAAKPVFVDFQLRPTDADELRLARNEMEWPTEDQGQIRDVDGSTGDLQVIPMIEITIPDAAHELPTEVEMGAYAISLRGTAAGERRAYVPLNLITDDRTGERVAFSGRMRYESQADWGPDHQVDFVWAVQVDNDIPCDPDDVDDVAQGCTADGYIYNEPQIVHSYISDWNLTGLSVTEEHGSDIAVIFEDPMLDPLDGAEADAPTWALSNVLAQRFLSATPGATGANDLTLDNIDEQLDHTLNTSIPHGLADVFRVSKQSFATFAEGIERNNSTQIPDVLAAHFDSQWTASNSITPLLVTTYETRARSLTMDSTIEGAGYVDVTGASVAVDLHPAGQLTTPINATGGMKWTSYCGGSGGAVMWTRCDETAVLEELDARYGDAYVDPADPSVVQPAPADADVNRGQTYVTQMYSLTMMQGMTALLSQEFDGQTTFVGAQYASLLESELVDESRAVSGLRSSSAGGKFIANKKFLTVLQDGDEALKEIGKTRLSSRAKAKLFSSFKKTSNGTQTGIMAGVFVAVVATSILVAYLVGGEEGVAVAIKAVGSVLALASVVNTVNTSMTLFRSGLTSAKSAGAFLQLSSVNLGATSSAAWLGAAITVGVTFGFFISSIVSNNVAAFSPEFNAALASTVSTSIFAISMAALSLSVVGLIVVGIVALIDAVLALACELGADDLRSDYTDGGCFSLSGAAIKTLTTIIYAYDVMVDPARAGLIDPGTPVIGLADDSVGYVQGNTLNVSLPITSNIAHKPPEPEAWQIIPYLWFFSEDNLRSTTFNSSLTSPDAETLSAQRDQMTSDWDPPVVDGAYVEKDLYRTQASETLQVVGGMPFDTVGINQEFQVHLNTAYALPAFECWPLPLGLPPAAVPICYTRTFDGTNSSSFDPYYFDVLPATITEFMQLTERGNGQFGLAWDDSFPTISDADGDGALAGADGGLDRDDSDWDSDNDGLSDAFELQQREAGYAISSGLWDTDGDGLTDAQELSFGTDPGVTDTDNDGLTDGEELRHMEYVAPGGVPAWNGQFAGGWDVTIVGSTPQLVVSVSSDPLQADGDQDGLSDQAERQLAALPGPTVTGAACTGATPPAGCDDPRLDADGLPYHPNVANTPPVRLAMSVDNSSGFVAPGEAVNLTTEMVSTTALSPSVLDITLPSTVGASPVPQLVPFDPATFVPGETQTRTNQTSFTAPTAASEMFIVEADLRARLEPTAPTGAPMNATVNALPDSAQDRSDVAIASSNNTTTDRFVVAEGSRDAATGAGDVRNIPLPDGPATSLDVDTEAFTFAPDPVAAPVSVRNDYAYVRPELAPEVACTDAGNCMTVWEHVDQCRTLRIDSLTVLSADDDNGASDGIEPLVYLRRLDDAGDRIGDGALLWQFNSNGGADIGAGTVLSGAGNRLPVVVDYCGDVRLTVRESDGSMGNDQYFWYTQVENPGPFGPSNNFEGEFFDELSTKEQADDVQFDLDFLGSDGAVRLDLTVLGKQEQPVAGAVTNAAGTVITPQFDLRDVADHPVVDNNASIASNGDNFMVAWAAAETFTTPANPPTTTTDTTTVIDKVYQQRFNADGSALDPSPTEIFSWNRAGSAATQIYPSVTWTGSKYIVAVLDPSLDPLANPLARPVFELKTWNDVSGEVTLATDVTSTGTDDRFDLAHDPITGRTALAYVDRDSNVVVELFDAGATTPALSVNPVRFGSSTPKIAYNPMTQGWILSVRWNGQLQVDSLDSGLVRLDGDLPLGVSPIRSALACPAIEAFPAVDLRFEELPGTTTFADSSPHGRDGSSSTVIPAKAGAPGAPNSEFSLGFDAEARGGPVTMTTSNPILDHSSGDRTVAFWYRAEEADAGTEMTLGNNGFGVIIEDNTIKWNTASEHQTVNASLNDGAWHFIAATDDRTSKTASLYVDGVLIGTAGGDNLTGPADSTFKLRNDAGRARVDNFAMYTTALSADTITNIFNRSQNSYCAVVSTTYTTNPAVPSVPAVAKWVRLDFPEQDNRGGRIEAAATARLTVDADAPISQATSLPPQKATGAQTTIVLGGEANDAAELAAPADRALASGVALVEVSIDGGPWTQAAGAESWSHVVNLTAGSHAVRTRATDAVGNVEVPGPAVTVVVDGTAPNVVVFPRLTVQVPDIDSVTGQISVNISGTVDTGATLVEVRVFDTGTTPLEQGWQTATVTGIIWSLDYLFSSTATEITGDFSVHIRAVDGVGNRTDDDAAATTLALDSSAPTAAIDADTEALRFIANPMSIGGTITENGPAGVSTLDVAVTSLQAVVTDPDAATLDWQAATLTQFGGGVGQADWSFTIGAGIEDYVQIDLRATDMRGNERVIANVWRGIIDTRAPRITMTGASTGKVQGGGQQFEFTYTCSAEDLFLNEEDFECPGESVETPIRTFNNDPAIQALFPDQTTLTQLDVEYNAWEITRQAGATLRACDRFGNCAVQTTSPTATVAAPTVGAAIVSPTDGQHVTAESNGDVGIVVAATGGEDSIKSITLSLDGTTVDQRDFAQGAVTRFQESIAVAIPAGGLHSVEVRVEDWSGTVELSTPTAFFVDLAAPTLTLETTPALLADTWAVGSDTVRLSGTVSDAGTVAAVQVKVNDQPWFDATFDAAGWRTAQLVPGVDGTDITVRVRAVDLAGRVTEISGAKTVNLVPDPASPVAYVRPDTAFTGGPSAPTTQNSATFTFTGTPGDNAVAGASCRLDGGNATPCASPFTIADLSAGSHTLLVTAIDDQGYADLSPASRTWMVLPSGPAATFTVAPTDPSPDRNVMISFDGPAGATFTCALDGATPAPCTSPVTSTELRAGAHSFVVSATVGGVTGTAARHVWTYVDAPPVAFDDTLVVVQDDVDGAAITLVAADAGPVVYRIVDKPLHGILDGVGRNLRYLPFAGYTGTDRFTFQADDGQSVSNVATIAVAVSSALATDAGDDLTADEGDLVSLVDAGYVQSATPNAPITATVNWGDGTNGPGTIVDSGATGTIDASHTYLDNGTYTAEVVADDGRTARDTTTVEVANVAPTATLQGAAVLPGTGAEVNGTYADPGTLDTHTGSIDWGDGTTEPLALSGGAGGGTFAANHQYATGGIFDVVVTITDDDGGAVDAPLTLLIHPVAALSLEKSITAVADVNSNGFLDADDTVTYSFALTNTGANAVAPVRITDSNLGLAGAACTLSGETLGAPNGILDIGESADCVLPTSAATYVITTGDVADGGVENSALATATPVVSVLDLNGDPTTLPTGQVPTVLTDPATSDPVDDVVDRSDAGTEPEGAGSDPVTGDPTPPTAVLDPSNTNTPNPISVLSNAADPGDDPTTLLLSNLTIAKSAGALIDHNDGTYSVDYTLTVENRGRAPGVYTLDDEVVTHGTDVTTAVTAPPAYSATATDTQAATFTPGFDARIGGQTEIIADETIAGGATDVFTYRTTFTVSAGGNLSTATDCGTSTATAALTNTASLSTGPTATDCGDLPQLNIAKTSDAPVEVAGIDDTYDVDYTITVTNSGTARGDYDLDDVITPSTGITIVSVSDPAYGGDADGTLGTINADFDGAAAVAPAGDGRIVTGESIGHINTGVVTETWTYTVRYTVDPLTFTASQACAGSLAPSAVRNVATLSTGADNEGCTDFPDPAVSFDTEHLSLELVGDNRYELAYELTVTNTGGGTTYDLADEFGFVDGVAVTRVTVTTPRGVVANAAFDGEADTVVASNVVLSGGRTHVYRVVVVLSGAGVDLSQLSTLDCTIDPGETTTGLTTRSAASTADGVNTDTGCTPYPPGADIQLTTVGPVGPIVLPAGETVATVVLEITATNNGPQDATGVVITDTLPAGAKFVSATAGPVAAASARLGGATCDHAGGIVTCDVGRLANGSSVVISLTFTVTATVDTSATNRVSVSADQPDPVATNNVVGGADGGGTTVIQVTPVAPTGPDLDGRLPATGSDPLPVLPVAFLLLILGAGLLLAGRRFRRTKRLA